MVRFLRLGRHWTPEGRAREKVIDDLCAAAVLARDQPILRDKEVLKLGDSISRFMRRIGASDRVFVILSDKYLRSSYCMFELLEIWRNCRQDEGRLGRSGCGSTPWVTLTSGDPLDVGAVCQSLEDRARGAGSLHVLSLGKNMLIDPVRAALKRMREFHHHVGDILATFADIVQPRSFEDLVRYGFDSTIPDPEVSVPVPDCFRQTTEQSSRALARLLTASA